MKRTQIYLEEDLDASLRAAAAAAGRSAADLIREAVRAHLGLGQSKTSKDPFLAIAGRFRGGPRDAAADHDKYLYRASSKRTKR